MSKDYYKTLGIEKGAGKDEIKKAFHKLAMKHHPDKNGGDDTKFKEINEAYQTLSDDQKRAQYDQFGSGYQNMGGGAGGFGGGQGGFDFSGFKNGGFEFDMGDLGDIFGDMFGGGGRSAKRAGSDLAVRVNITFAEMVLGVEKEINIRREAPCDHCKSTGAENGTELETCTTCKGAGSIREVKRTILGNIQTQSICGACEGVGKIPKRKCGTCRGAGTINKNENIKVHIPAGIHTGENLRLVGYGEAIKNGPSGNLYIAVTVLDDKNYKREGNTIYRNIQIPLTASLLGGEIDVETFDGTVSLKIPEGIKNGEVLRMKGRGIHTSTRGDIHIIINTRTLQKLSREQRKLIEELKNTGL